MLKRKRELAADYRPSLAIVPEEIVISQREGGWEHHDICGSLGCDMRNLCNPLTRQLDVRSVYMCVRCFRTHLCDLRNECSLVSTLEGSVCSKTGLVYESVFPAVRVDALEPIGETSVDDVNIVGIVISYVYGYLMSNSEHYADVIREVIEDGKLKKKVENAVYFTFNKVFKSGQNVHKVSVPVIGQLFIQLIIGVHAKDTKYDPSVIKVSRRKREDALLKQMRFEYGNAPFF